MHSIVAIVNFVWDTILFGELIIRYGIFRSRHAATVLIYLLVHSLRDSDLDEVMNYLAEVRFNRVQAKEYGE